MTTLYVNEDEFDSSEHYNNFSNSEGYSEWLHGEKVRFITAFNLFFIQYFKDRGIRFVCARLLRDEYEFNFATEQDVFLFKLKML